MTFIGCPRSSDMSGFDKAYMISYYCSIVTMALCCIVSRYSQILIENCELYIPTCIRGWQRLGWLRWNFAKVFSAGKTKMIGLPKLKTVWWYSSSSRMRVMNHNWSATKQRPHLQSVAEISRHSVLSGDRIRQCETSSGSRHKDTDILNRFDTIAKRDGRTDGRTDGQNSYINIALTRDN